MSSIFEQQGMNTGPLSEKGREDSPSLRTEKIAQQIKEKTLSFEVILF